MSGRLIGTGKAWPWLITLLFLGNAGLAAAVLHFSRTDPSFAVEPDYYERALSWDVESAALARGASLDRVVEADAEAGRLRVELRDAAGDRFAGATVRAMAFHHARMADAQEAAMEEVSPGVYEAAVAFGREGRWEVRLEALRDGERSLTSDTVRVGER